MTRGTQIVIGIAALALLIYGGLSFFQEKEPYASGTPEPTPRSSPDAAPSPVPSGTAAAAATPSPPDLAKPVTVSAPLSAESRARALEEIRVLRAELTENTGLYPNWMQLALQMKLVGDYREAEAIWKYAIARWPDEATPYGNLGNLYIYELQDFVKAETYLLKSIEKQGRLTLANAYYAAYEFYRFVLKDPEKARAVLRRGIAASPEDAAMLKGYLDELERSSLVP